MISSPSGQMAELLMFPGCKFIFSLPVQDKFHTDGNSFQLIFTLVVARYGWTPNFIYPPTKVGKTMVMVIHELDYQ